MGGLIKTEKFSEQLRQRAIKIESRQILISRLQGSDQQADISEPVNCGGYGRIRHFRQRVAPGWVANQLPVVPACRALGITPFPEMLRAQVFQNAACGWRCWYCFVPYDLLKADEARSKWMTAEELVTLYAAESDRPLVVDLSGGSPDLVPEWTLWMMRALKSAGLANSTYLWTDDNLSTTYLFDKLAEDDLSLIRSYSNYGRVCCFKGFDERSFSFNTRASGEGFARQFEIMRRVLGLGIDAYGYVTLTSPKNENLKASIVEFIDRLQTLDELLPLRIVPLQIRVFKTVNARIHSDDALQESLDVQEEAISAWQAEMGLRFNENLRALDIASVPLTTREPP